MTVLDLLTYRGTLITLNALSLLFALVLLIAALMGAPRIGGSLLALAAPGLALASLLERRRRKGLLAAVIVSNVLLFVLSLPYLFFSARNGIPAPWFASLALAYFVVPLLTGFTSWLRWPREGAPSNDARKPRGGDGPSSSDLPGQRRHSK